jgi:CDP-diacylglycerol---serine O-phosphatidyltransferase
MFSPIKKNIPNAITCLNLLSGCVALVLSFKKEYVEYAPYFIFLAAVFDFFDGFAARMLHSYSEFGKQLDSLADVVSFGLAPAAIMFNLLDTSLVYQNGNYDFEVATIPQLILLFSAFLIAIFSALRLAKFNIDQNQSDKFIGLPTPANALFISSLLLIVYKVEALQFIVLNIYFLIGTILISSYLLVSNITMFSLKFKTFDFKNNKLRYIFITISALLIVTFGVLALPLVILLYVILSIVNNVFLKIS